MAVGSQVVADASQSSQAMWLQSVLQLVLCRSTAWLQKVESRACEKDGFDVLGVVTCTRHAMFRPHKQVLVPFRA